MQSLTSLADQRTTILALLERYLPNTTVWVYGSRAKWTARPQSDLDMVVFATPEQDRQVSGLREAFEESSLPFRVDLFVWDSVPEQFRKRIEVEHVVLVEKEEQSAKGGWKTVTLGEFASFTYGKGLPVGKRNPSGVIPVFGSNGIVGYHDSPLTDGPTIIIGRKGTVGAVHYSPIPCWPIDTTFFVSGDDPTLTRFKYYALSVLGLEHMNSDSAVPGLNRSAAHARTLLLPRESEQRAIAHILGTLDDKIELNRRMNETLEEMARALFKSWFVDFDPVRAKMEGRDPGLPKHLADLFPNQLVDSELGLIPEGWEVKALEKFIELNPRESIKKGTIAPYLNMAALPTSGPNPDDTILREFTSGTRFRNGDTLFARITPCLENGKTAFVQALPKDTVGWGSTEFIVMRAIPPVTSVYPYLLARDPVFRAHAIQSMTGTSGRQRARTEALAPYQVTFPTTEIWTTFTLIIEPLFSKIKATSEESRTLAALRDALLPRLVSGTLLIGNVETLLDGGT